MTATLTGVIVDIFPQTKYKDFVQQTFWLQELNKPLNQGGNIWQISGWHDDGIAMLRDFKKGDVVECQVRILGRKWKASDGDKVTNTLKCESMKLF